METLERLVERKSREYSLGQDSFAILLKRMVQRGRELKIVKDAITASINRTVRFTLLCENPYLALLSIVEAYGKSPDTIRAQGLIGSLDMNYRHMKISPNKSRFTKEEVDEMIYVLTE